MYSQFGLNKFFLQEVEFLFHGVLVSLKPYFHCNLVSKIFVSFVFEWLLISDGKLLIVDI